MNRLVPNSSKSKLMLFSTRPTHYLPELLFANEVIKWVNEFKYLGLTITNRLCFAHHISKVALNISRITGMFVNIKIYCSLSVTNEIILCLGFSSPDQSCKHLGISACLPFEYPYY